MAPKKPVVNPSLDDDEVEARTSVTSDPSAVLEEMVDLVDATLPDEVDLTIGEEIPVPEWAKVPTEIIPAVELGPAPLKPTQFNGDADLYATAVRLSAAGLLSGVAQLKKDGNTQFDYDVVITCRDIHEFNLIAAALPKHLTLVSANAATLTIVVHESLYDDQDLDDDFSDPDDLEEDAAFTDEDLEQLTRPPTGDDLKPGDILFAATGEYRVNHVFHDTVSLRHRINGAEVSISIKADDVAKLLQAKGYEEQIDPVDSIDVDPIIPSLQQQLAEAAAENNRLRNELDELRTAVAEEHEAQAAMESAERHIQSMTVVFSDVERQTGDKRIAELIAAGWWLVPHSEHFLVRTNAKGSQVIDHAMRFEYTASRQVSRTEQALATLDEPEDLPLIDDATEGEPALVHALETSSS